MPTTITKTIRASGGDYTTLSAWEAALPASLVANDECHVAECYNDWPSGLNDAVTISGPTTDATRFIKVTVAVGHRHDGTPQTGFYLKGDKGSNAPYFNNSPSHTVLEWLDVEHTRIANSSDAIRSTGQNCLVSNCISKSRTTTETASAFSVLSGSNTESTWPVVLNCLAWGGTHGFSNRIDLARQRANYYNCVAVNCGTGFPGHFTVPGRVINCVAYNCTTDFSASGYHTDSKNNASEDSSASIFTDSITGIVSADFVDATNNDFHLAPGSALIGAGTNLYSTFTTDIDGDTRPSSGAWDIGFDHYVAVGGAYTLTCEYGTYTLAGQTADITFTPLATNYTLTCEHGVYSLAGQTVSTSKGRTLTAEHGLYALSGQTADITYTPLDTGYTITALHGDYTLNGQSADLRRSRLLSAPHGEYAVLGQDATVTVGAYLSDSDKIDLILDILQNRQTLDPLTGMYTLYADDGVTVLYTAQAWEDAAGTVPYRGRQLQRLDSMV